MSLKENVQCYSPLVAKEELRDFLIFFPSTVKECKDDFKYASKRLKLDESVSKEIDSKFAEILRLLKGVEY